MKLHSQDEEFAVKEILACMDASLDLAARVHEVIGRLSEKRVTLEEKMIRGHYHEMATCLYNLNALIHEKMRAIYISPERVRKMVFKPEDGGFRDNELTEAIVSLKDSLKDLVDVQKQISRQLDDLIKSLSYDLNFTEQYFEHGFYSRITNDEDYLSVLKSILQRMAKV